MCAFATQREKQKLYGTEYVSQKNRRKYKKESKNNKGMLILGDNLEIISKNNTLNSTE